MAWRTVTVVACSAPPAPAVPRATMHVPCAIACAVAVICLVYVVASVTVTVVCEASGPVTVMVFPLTEATVPWTAGCLAGALDDGADGVVADRAGGCFGCRHWPSAAGLTCTDCAVIAVLSWVLSRVGRTLTQLPAVTSVSCAGVISVTVVDGVRSTVADPLCCRIWMVLPDTAATRPATCCRPRAGELAGLADGAGLFDVPHPARDRAIAAAIVRLVSRAGRRVRHIVGINSPIVGLAGADAGSRAGFTLGGEAISRC